MAFGSATRRANRRAREALADLEATTQRRSLAHARAATQQRSHELRTTVPAWLRRQVGVVLQENFLFNRSVRDNIALTDPGLSMMQVIQASKLAGAHEFILELADGYDTVVGERGTTRCEMHSGRWLVTREPGATWDEQASCTLERDDMFVEQARRMLAAVEGASPVTCTLDEGRQTLRVNLAVLEAADHRRWVDVKQ